MNMVESEVRKRMGKKRCSIIEDYDYYSDCFDLLMVEGWIDSYGCTTVILEWDGGETKWDMLNELKRRIDDFEYDMEAWKKEGNIPSGS